MVSMKLSYSLATFEGIALCDLEWIIQMGLECLKPP